MADREAATAPRFDRGTPETRTQAKKRGPGTIQALIERGTIGGYEVRAADEIERVFNFITAGLGAKIMRYDERVSPSRTDHVPAWFFDAYARYKPWARQALYIKTTVEIVVENQSGRQLDARYGRKRGVSVSLLIDSLRDYAISAGWVDSNTLDDWRRES